ncbi:uncharacterized protein LOC142767080 [Rhipicephalus microplus]|uniref:uncharacterized protein LOC142767080 n=1 Tax=Rhipicephalus microplus TaxID=6941 RepID=UPI003F6B2BAD
MYLNHRPKTIMVHCSPCNFTGPYARWLEGIPFTFVSAVFPSKVFGRPILEGNPHHSTDVVRVHALLRHGGIYLDADVFVVQSLRRFLRYEATVACPQGYTFGNMIMISHKNSRILRLFMDTYREFNGSLWDYNSAVVPTERFVVKRPHMFHHVDHGLHTHPFGIYRPHYFPDWRNAYALHTIFNHRYIVPEDPLNNVELNETTLRDYDTAMGEMARSVIFGTSDFVGPEAPVLSVAELAAMKDRGIDLTQMRNESSKPFYVVN